ncbi:hypothetical protein WMY93_032544 [Mugilogobius chulae]|uniref:NLR family CARD domain-containing protein 3-like n=1 Tax=Mugilogobius chulae TaxID=88201 RepID=A0AAW0MVD4_9GOBI
MGTERLLSEFECLKPNPERGQSNRSVHTHRYTDKTLMKEEVTVETECVLSESELFVAPDKMELLLLLLLLLLLWTSAGQEPESVSVSCVVMETCVLPCSFEGSGIDLIRWSKTEENLVVHAHEQGTDLMDMQDPPFRGRTSLFPELISGGNTSLQLTQVKVSDQGTYLCQVFTTATEAKKLVHLRVEGKICGQRRLQVLFRSSSGPLQVLLRRDKSVKDQGFRVESRGGFKRSGDEPGSSVAVVVGVIVFVLLLVVAGVVVFFLWKRKKNKENQNLQTPGPEEQGLLPDDSRKASSLERRLQEALGPLSEDESQKVQTYLQDQSLMGEFQILHRKDVEKDGLIKSLLHVYGENSFTVTQRLLEHLQRNKEAEDDTPCVFGNHPLPSRPRPFPSGYFASCQCTAPYLIPRGEMIRRSSEELKSSLTQRFKFLPEDLRGTTEKMEFTEGFTELFITVTESEQIHQVLCQDIFKPRPHSPQPIRAVLTVGVAGVGKTVLTQKFSLDWAEGRTNQELQLLFPFTFRDLNVLSDKFSLVELLQHFFSPSKDLCSFTQLQVLFIFDGLDECRLPLDFSRTRVLTDPTESVSVDVLLVNLIRGSLLPSALLWITTRPAAANQIPAECVSMVTEVRGFTDLQKEQYFRKSSTEASGTNRGTRAAPDSHTDVRPLPGAAAQTKNSKYKGKAEVSVWSEENKKMVLSLSKLAFEQLQKENQSDLSECGLDAEVYSGVFKQVFRADPGEYQTLKVFLAALHVHQVFVDDDINLLKVKSSSIISRLTQTKPKLFDLHRSAVDQALHSPNGHLDMFLRFLLGLSLSTNQRLLQGLLTHTGSDTTNQETVKYIKQKLNEKSLSAERSLNLFHCLIEMNDDSLVQKAQKNMSKRKLSDKDMSHADWSALSFVLLSSDSDLQEFDLRKYDPSERALLGLLPVVKASTKALLSGCGLSPHSCGPLASVLSSSSLTHLDLSHNDLQDSGVELLCEGLKSAPCRLETLRLSGCLVSERGGAALVSALSSAHSRLRDIDLSYNNLGPSAEKKLTALQNDTQRPLQSVRLVPAGKQFLVPGLRKYWCEFSLDPNSAHRRLLLSDDKQTVTHMKEDQKYPDHQDRFKDCPQVLSSTGLRGRCYWEVNWSGDRVVSIAVSYKGIQRRGIGKECVFGYNDQSWSLRICQGKCSVWHNNEETKVCGWLRSSGGVSSDRVGVSSGRVGVFLDSEAGVLSFYQILSDDKVSHIHTFSCCFSEELFPGFGLGPGSSVTLLKLCQNMD